MIFQIIIFRPPTGRALTRLRQRRQAPLILPVMIQQSAGWVYTACIQHNNYYIYIQEWGLISGEVVIYRAIYGHSTRSGLWPGWGRGGSSLRFLQSDDCLPYLSGLAIWSWKLHVFSTMHMHVSASVFWDTEVHSSIYTAIAIFNGAQK